MKTMWLVNWGDLSMICETKEEGMGYIEAKAKQINADIRWIDIENTYMEFLCIYNTCEVWCYQLEEIPVYNRANL